VFDAIIQCNLIGTQFVTYPPDITRWLVCQTSLLASFSMCPNYPQLNLPYTNYIQMAQQIACIVHFQIMKFQLYSNLLRCLISWGTFW